MEYARCKSAGAEGAKEGAKDAMERVKVISL